jgi:hypothetical protein
MVSEGGHRHPYGGRGRAWRIGQLVKYGKIHQMNKGKYIDPFLEKRLVIYDEWLNKGRISYSSKVIPISEVSVSFLL